ncbi:MAG: proline dehydrogenase [Sphingopyxis sp.]
MAVAADARRGGVMPARVASAAWAQLRALRYAGPRHAGGWMPAPDAAWVARRARALDHQGMAATVGYFQADDADAGQVFAANRALLGQWPNPHGTACLAVKAPPMRFALPAIFALAQAAARVDVPLIFDAHGPADAARTLALVDQLLPDFPGTGAVLPARWARSQMDARHLRDSMARVRVVRGEWPDAPDTPQAPDMCDAPHFAPAPAHGWGGVDGFAGDDAAFLRLIGILAGRAAPVAVATHRPHVARAALALLARAGTPCELELLRGLPARACRAVAGEMGVAVRYYLPFGPGWWPYAINKALARPDLPLAFARDWWAARRVEHAG